MNEVFGFLIYTRDCSLQRFNNLPIKLTLVNICKSINREDGN